MHKAISLSRIQPNTWNPNHMSGAELEKLERGMLAILEETKKLPPIVVRRIGDKSERKYEIIDGYHRYKVMKKLGHEKIDAFILNVSDKQARILTLNLNYLRGKYDPKQYVNVLDELARDGESVASLADILPESEGELNELIDMWGSDELKWNALKESETKDKEEAEAADDDNTFIEMTFVVSKSQGEVIQAELRRIGDTLQGKNIEGRALEFMAVMSSQTPLEEPEEKPKKKKRKAA